MLTYKAMRELTIVRSTVLMPMGNIKRFGLVSYTQKYKQVVQVNLSISQASCTTTGDSLIVRMLYYDSHVSQIELIARK